VSVMQNDDSSGEKAGQDPNDLNDPNDQPNPEARRGCGRLRIVRTGLRGRPRKEYQAPNLLDEHGDMASLAEIPLEQTFGGPDAKEWYRKLASELKLIMKNDT